MKDPDYMRSREAYDAFVADLPRSARWQWWPVPWRLATKRERAVILALWAGESVMVIGGTFALVLLAAMLLDGLMRTTEHRDVCLKAATTGHQIRECAKGKFNDRGPPADLRRTGPAERGADR